VCADHGNRSISSSIDVVGEDVDKRGVKEFLNTADGGLVCILGLWA
jgi:hypothetical protein